jgi:hypothetical protein
MHVRWLVCVAFSASSFAPHAPYAQPVRGRGAMNGAKSADGRLVGAPRAHADRESCDARQLHLREFRVDDVGPEQNCWR